MAFESYLVHLGILVCIYAILAVSLNLSVGFTGLLNFGHVGFFGIGAYASAILVLNGVPPLIAVPIAALMAALFGILLTLPTARLKGDYLALATLGFAFIVGSIARNWLSLTRGPLGIPGIPKLLSSPEMILIAYAIAAFVIYIVITRLIATPFGRTLQAIRDDELAAQALGKDTTMYKVIALSISAFLAGIAGSFFAHYIGYIDPTIVGLGEIILLFSAIIVGGLASIKGSFIGTLIVLLLPEPLRFIGFSSAVIGPMRMLFFSLILLVILIYKPRGLFGKVDLQ